jgi:hypothetical protein
MLDNAINASKRADGLLFAALAEQVKLPFMTIAHAAELLRLNPGADELEKLLATISLTSDAAMKLIDGYLLSVQLQQGATLPLEPVSLGSVVYDTAQRLAAYARAHDCEIEVDIRGRYGPVMARTEVVKTALEALGYSFIEAASRPGLKTKVVVSVRKISGGISAGVYSDMAISSALFKQAKILKGLARQPLGDFSAGSGAGVFVADALFDWLDSPMRVARLSGLQGLASTLIPSRQLNLV